MLLDKVESSNRAARLKDSYDSPNWAFLQADQRGYERAMYEVIALIIEDDKEKDTSSQYNTEYKILRDLLETSKKLIYYYYILITK